MAFRQTGVKVDFGLRVMFPMPQIDLRRLTGGICMASRYLATVRRAAWNAPLPSAYQPAPNRTAVFQVFVGDQLAQPRLDGGGRALAARVGFSALPKKYFNVKDTTRT